MKPSISPWVEMLVQDAQSKGAKVHTGGKRIGNKGYFFEPTVLTNVPREARIMNEEPFGPLAIIRPFDTFDEAVGEANRLPARQHGQVLDVAGACR